MDLKLIASRIVDFEKIAWEGKRRINKVTVDLCLYKKDNGEIRFTACGDVWNSKQTDIIAGGQCLDELYKFLGKNKTYQMIYTWWKNYHLNDSNPGTEKQMAALKEAEKQEPNKYWDYEACCNYLKSINLYEDNGYKYGHGWIYKEIPQETLNEMVAFMSAKN